MPDFFNRLSHELITSILCYLTHSECLEAMSVSHQWFDNIPSHVNYTLWSQINFWVGPARTSNARLLQCLGPHVQKVTLTYKQLKGVFKTFQEYNVSPKSLCKIKQSFSFFIIIIIEGSLGFVFSFISTI